MNYLELVARAREAAAADDDWYEEFFTALADALLSLIEENRKLKEAGNDLSGIAEYGTPWCSQ